MSSGDKEPAAIAAQGDGAAADAELAAPPAAPSASQAPERRSLFSPRRAVDSVICLLLVVSVCLVFGQTARHNFINFDDDEYVYENRHVLDGLSVAGVAWAFTHTDVGAYWHPLTVISLMADAELLKPKTGPPDRARLAARMHLVNVALHAANAVLLFLLLRGMTANVWRSALVAAIFAVHPLHVESVAWITERKDVLSGLFGLLALMAYASYARRPGLVRYAAVAVALTLGLMCKPMLATWPLVFLLLDYWPLRRAGGGERGACGAEQGAGSGEQITGVNGSGQQAQRAPGSKSMLGLVVEKVPFLLLVAASAIVTFLAQRSSGAVASLQSVSIFARLARAAVLYVTYLGKSLWPSNLAAVYPVDPIAGYWPAAGAAALLVLLTCGAVWGASRGQRWLATGWFWYLGTLVPTIGLVQVGSEVMADRFLYLPQIGLCVAVAWGLGSLAFPVPIRRIVFSVAGSLALAALTVCATRQAAFWRDDITLWTQTLNCTANNYIAEFHLGLAWSAQGQIDKAIPQYEETVRILPNFPEAHFNLACALDSLGQVDAAQRHYESALRARPNYAKARNNLGMIFYNRGNIGAAAQQFQSALEVDPGFALAQNNLGLTLMAAGEYAAAADRYRQAIALDPDFPQPHANLGFTLGRMGRNAEAVTELRKFLQVQPQNIKVLGCLAWVLATTRDDAVRNGAEALGLARKAAALTHGSDPVILDALAAALAETGQYPAAAQTAVTACNLAQATGQTVLAAEIGKRIEIYRKARPFHQ